MVYNKRLTRLTHLKGILYIINKECFTVGIFGQMRINNS